MKKGILLIFLIIIVFAGMTYFIKYPDVIETTAILNAEQAPKPVVAYSAGRLMRLTISEGANVDSGSILGYLESSANIKQIKVMTVLLDSFHKLMQMNIKNHDLNMFVSDFDQLGELQNEYYLFMQAFFRYEGFTNNGIYAKKLKMLENDLIQIELAKKNLFTHKALVEEDLRLMSITFNANEKLLKDKIISEQEYRELSSRLISKKMSIPQIQESMISHERMQSDKQKELFELKDQIARERFVFIEAINRLRNGVVDWEKRYLLIAPTAGYIRFSSFVQENQQIKKEQVIAYVTPKNENYYMQLYVPQENLGHVKIGQLVRLKFLSYPWQQFGTIDGFISFISSMPSENGYLAKISLPNGLITDMKYSIIYKEGLIANASIVTNDLRLIHHFLENIRK